MIDQPVLKSPFLLKRGEYGLVGTAASVLVSVSDFDSIGFPKRTRTVPSLPGRGSPRTSWCENVNQQKSTSTPLGPDGVATAHSSPSLMSYLSYLFPFVQVEERRAVVVQLGMVVHMTITQKPLGRRVTHGGECYHRRPR